MVLVGVMVVVGYWCGLSQCGGDGGGGGDGGDGGDGSIMILLCNGCGGEGCSTGDNYNCCRIAILNCIVGGVMVVLVVVMGF